MCASAALFDVIIVCPSCAEGLGQVSQQGETLERGVPSLYYRCFGDVAGYGLQHMGTL